MKKNIDIYTVALANAWNTLDVAHLKDLLVMVQKTFGKPA